MNWADSEASDEILVGWAKEMWWCVWVRQCWVNYTGMWKSRFAKEDKKLAKEKESTEEESKGEDEANIKEVKREKILERPSVLEGRLLIERA